MLSGHPAEAVVGHEAVSHRDDSVGDLADLSRVSDDDEGLTAVLVEPDHQVHDLVGRLAVEVAGRLVGPYDGGAINERPRDGDPLALASREFAGKVVGTVRKADFL